MEICSSGRMSQYILDFQIIYGIISRPCKYILTNQLIRFLFSQRTRSQLTSSFKNHIHIVCSPNTYRYFSILQSNPIGHRSALKVHTTIYIIRGTSRKTFCCTLRSRQTTCTPVIIHKICIGCRISIPVEPILI